MHRHLKTALSHSIEAAMMLKPHALPSADRLAAARIVSHRGERSRGIRENTLAAFDAAVAAGVAAIEFDIRYTRDDEPVVLHDSDLKRVHGQREAVSQLSWQQLQRIEPQVPHLHTLLARYTGRAHFMVEIKTRGSERAEARLAEQLDRLTPTRDYHVLALDPALFQGVSHLPSACFLPVAQFNLRALYAWACSQACAGLAGPFASMRQHHIRRLRDEREVIATGFVASAPVLRRELARGVDWIFSNHAAGLQRALDRMRAGYRPR